METRARTREARLWPAVAIVALILPAAIVAQVAAQLGWMVLDALGAVTNPGPLGSGATPYPDEGPTETELPGLALVATITMQAALAALAFLGVLLARREPRVALGFAPGRARGLAIPAMLGTLFVSAVSQVFWELRFDEPSDHLVAIGELVTETSAGMFLAILVSFSVLPGLCEELLFRGFLQRHLLRRWSALPAVGLTSLLFAGIHLDPQHVWSVLPLALWLGYVGWRSDALMPAILCHAFNNAFSILMMRAAPSTVETTSWTWTIAMAAVGLPAFLWTVRQLERRARAQGTPPP